MSDLPARNRVIYQSEALFVSPDTTGHHLYYEPPLETQALSAVEKTGDACILAFMKQNGTEVTFNTCLGGIVGNGVGQRATVSESLINRTVSCNTLGKEFDIYPAWSGKSSVLGLIDGFTTGATVGAVTSFGYLDPTSDNPETSPLRSAASQLKRVQNANYSFTINRQDVNQFGQLARIDSVILESPTVSMDFSYYLTDGENERLLGMVTNGKAQNLSGVMTRAQNDYGNNFFILTVPEGRDAVVGDQNSIDTDKTVISAGNAYITDYSIEGSVGSFPTASVSVEALNIKSDVGVKYNIIPAIDSTDGTKICDTCFSLPPAESGDGTSVLKPGDITIDLQDSALLSKQISGADLGYGPEDKGSAHIQSFTISTPMGRTSLQRLGNSYAYAKEVDFPVTCTLSVNALVSDLKDGNLVDLMCGSTYDIKVKMQDPKCIDCNPNTNPPAFIIDFKKAVLDSESFSSAIGDNKTVDLSFSTQIGGPEDSSVGVFISGKENQQGADNKYRSFPTVENTGDGMKYYQYGHLGTAG
jgi:hypothetical protein